MAVCAGGKKTIPNDFVDPQAFHLTMQAHIHGFK